MTEQVALDPEQVKEYAKHDLDFFAKIVMPDAATLDFPDFYKWMWRELTSSADVVGDFSKFALGLPRGHGKTMIVKLFIVWCILYTQKRYALVLGANLGKGRAIISDVADCLDEPNVQTVYGDWRRTIEQDTMDLKKFYYGGVPKILQAAGYGTAIRGSNEKNSRPDLLIFDDAQTRDNAESLNAATEFQTWMLGDALKTKSPKGCTTVYIGNMYKDMYIDKDKNIYCCMLRNLQLSAEWTSMVVGAILADGTALWEELQPLKQLISDFNTDKEQGRQDIFFAEVQNDPRTVISKHINLSLIRPYVPLPGEQHQGNFIVIDPATSKNTKDELVIQYWEIYDDVPVLIEFFSGKKTSIETVHYTLELAIKRQCTLIAVEAVAYQFELCTLFRYIADQWNLQGIIVQDIYGGKSAKNGRILKMFGLWQTQKLRVSESCMSRCVRQAVDFNPLKTDNLDDILDAMEMAFRVCHEYRDLIPINITQDQYSSTTSLIPVAAHTNF